jgi:hypothetical protein
MLLASQGEPLPNRENVKNPVKRNELKRAKTFQSNEEERGNVSMIL